MSEDNRYGRLEFIEEAGRNKDRKVLWRMRCECGRIVVLQSYPVKSGRQKPCGCLRKQRLKEMKTRNYRGYTDEKSSKESS